MTPADSIGHVGHGEHAGPIFPETDADGNWGDIIRRSTTATDTIPGNFEAEVPGELEGEQWTSLMRGCGFDAVQGDGCCSSCDSRQRY